MSDIILLDGGMGQELYRLGYRSEQKIVWSATSLLEAPEVVQNVHEGFLQAGADVITTNSYCTNPYRLEKAGMLDHFKVMTQTACEVAAQARAKINPQARIAGALPPLYGSYQTSIQREPQKMLDEYRRMVELMQGHVDLFLCETITDISEARACAQAAHESGLPVWLAFTVSETLGADGQVVLRDGTLLSEALPRVMDLGLEALMVNCCPPEIVPMALDLLARYDWGLCQRLYHYPRRVGPWRY